MRSYEVRVTPSAMAQVGDAVFYVRGEQATSSGWRVPSMTAYPHTLNRQSRASNANSTNGFRRSHSARQSPMRWRTGHGMCAVTLGSRCFQTGLRWCLLAASPLA